MSGSIVFGSIDTRLTLKSRSSSETSTCFSDGGMPIIGMPGPPKSCIELITPMIGLSVCVVRVIARVMSYSSRRSRSIEIAGIDDFWSAKLTDRPR